MAEPIDFEFQLTDNMSGPANAIAAAMSKVSEQMKRANDRQDELDASKKKSLTTFARFRRGLFEITSIIKNGIDIAKDFGHSIFELGNHIFEATSKERKFISTLTELTGSKEQANELAEALERMRPFFIGTEDQMRGIVKQFLALGVTGEDTKKVLIAASDVGARLGDPAKANEFADAIANIAARGQVTAKHLVLLKKLVGVDLPVAAKTGSSQAITEILRFVAAQEGGALGNRSVKKAETIGQLFRRLAELPHEFFKGFKDSKAFTVLENALAGLFAVMGPMTPLFKQIQSTVSSALEKIVTILFGDLAGPGGKAKIEAFANTLIAFIDKIPVVIEGAVAAFNSFSAVIGAAWTLIMALGTALGETIATFYVFGESIIDSLQSANDSIAAFFKSVFGFFEGLYGMAVEWGANMIQGLVDGITGAYSKAVDAVEGVISGTVDKVKSLLGIESPSKVFAGFGAMSAEGFAQGIEGRDASVASAVEDVTGAAKSGAAGGIGGARNANVTFNINVDGSSGNAQQIASAVKSKIQELMPGAVASLFENMALEQGAA